MNNANGRNACKIKNGIVEFIQFKDLFFQLVSRDIKLKYRRSFLGYLWSILNPLLTMCVQATVFTLMFRRSIEFYPAYLIAGNILFGFMRESSSHSIYSITGNASLLKKTYVPKYIFTLSKVTSDLVNLLFSLVALFIVLLVTGVPFYRTWRTLLAIIPLIELYIFCIGLGLFISQAAVFFRDVQNIWPVVVNAWMYLTPLFYTIDILPKPLASIITKINPMYIYIAMFRDSVVYGHYPWSALIWRGLIVALLMLVIGMWSFSRAESKFILHI
uniref:ABC transporter permease n=1 Tax=Enterocloster asparagiformis TaxID=333367 RepID=UPI0036F2A171